MLNVVNITRKGKRGNDAEVLEVLEQLAEKQCCSAHSAAVLCIRSSPLFKLELRRLRAAGRAISVAAPEDVADSAAQEPVEQPSKPQKRGRKPKGGSA